jgi:hypothetical protein
LLALALALPFLLPLKPWFPDLETQLSDALGEQVRFDGLRAGLLPRPYLEAKGVRIGDDRALRATRARLYPDLMSLSAPTVFIRLTELDEVMVDRSAIRRFFSERDATKGGVQSIRLGHVHASHVKLDLLAGNFGEFEAEADLNRENRLTNFELTSADGRLKFDAVPASGALLLTFSAQDWKPPVGPPISFDRLYAQGALSDGKLAVSEFTAGLYRGDVRGGLELTWGKTWAIAGRAQISRLDLHPLLEVLQSPLPVVGTLDSELHFALEAADPAQLSDSMKLDGKFNLANGVLRDVDFPSVIQGAGSAGVRGGQTRFEQFTGNMQVGNGYRFTNMRLTSGKNVHGSELTVVGNVSVTAAGQVGGAMSVELKGTTTTLGSTVQTGGTLTDPVLLPGK